MVIMNRCADCGKYHNGKQKRCHCGYIFVTELVIDNERNEFQCQHWEWGRQCEYEGTKSKSIKRKKRKWFCEKHWYVN